MTSIRPIPTGLRWNSASTGLFRTTGLGWNSASTGLFLLVYAETLPQLGSFFINQFYQGLINGSRTRKYSVVRYEQSNMAAGTRWINTETSLPIENYPQEVDLGQKPA